MDLGINGRVAMVAAASKGLGLAIATTLAREGCRVSICGRDPASLTAAKHAITSAVSGAQVLSVQADVSVGADLDRWHAQTVERLGDPHILVTNTGGPPAGRFDDLKEEQWKAGIESTLMNVVRLTNLVTPTMRKRRWGRIVNITSFVAKQPTDILTVSSTLRAGLSALTNTLATQLAPDNVLVNAVLPGHFMTDRQRHLSEIRAKEASSTIEAVEAKAQAEIPLRRFGRPEELAEVVAFLCSEPASYVTGTSIPVDGGLLQSTF